jgi:hypothetical protein
VRKPTFQAAVDREPHWDTHAKAQGMAPATRICYHLRPMKCRPDLAFLSLFLFVAVTPARALEPWSAPFAEPLRFASLPLDAAEAAFLGPGQWTVSVSAGYFNLWSGSWHTATIHQELGLAGKPLTQAELRTLESRHPGDDIHRFDVEGWRSEVTVARGLPHNLTATVTIPWVEIGRPHWDAISQDFHRALGWGTGSREVFARSQTLAYVWSPRQRRAIERWGELDGGGLGDVRLTLAGPLGGWAGGEHRFVVSIEAPTGKENTLQGSGGWDAGARWVGTWTLPRAVFRGALGYTRLDRGGSFLGARRDDTYHALAELHHSWGRRGQTLLSVRYDTSPLATFSGGEPGKPVFFFTFGARRELSEQAWIGVALGENLIPRGVAPDFTLHLQLGTRFGE